MDLHDGRISDLIRKFRAPHRARLGCLVACGASLTPAAFGAPVFLRGSGLKDAMELPRGSFVAFAPKGTGWERVPYQWEELEDDGFLVVREPTQAFPAREKVNHPKDRDPFQGLVRRVHRLALDHADLGTCDAACAGKAAAEAAKACAAAGKGASRAVFRFDARFSSGTRSAFLAQCAASAKDTAQDAIQADAPAHILRAPTYALKTAAQNPALFDELAPPGKEPVLSGAVLRVVLKPKYFFNMTLERGDILSDVTSVKRQPLSTVVEFSTMLRSAFAKLVSVKQVCCDVSAFRDFVTAPLIFEIPTQLGKLGDGSSVFLGFAKVPAEPQVDLAADGVTLRFPGGDAGTFLLALRSRVPQALAKAKVLRGSEAKAASGDAQGTGPASFGILVPIGGGEAEGSIRFDLGFVQGKDETLLKEILLERYSTSLARSL